MATSSRMLTLLSMLQARRDWPGHLLAERLDISERTVRRDVERLRDLGYRISAIKGPDGGYRLDAGSELPPLLFDDEQAIALAVALRAAAVTGSGIDEAAVRALTTVRQVMPSRLRHRMDALDFTAMPIGGDGPVDSGTLIAVSTAIRNSETLRFDYVGEQSTATSRRVEPQALASRGGRWYLVGWDVDRDDWRVFRLDRMTLHTPNGRRFAPRELPGGGVADFVEGRFKGSSGANEWPCRGDVVFDAPLREVVPFVGDGLATAEGEGRTRVLLGSWSWAALAASLGRFAVDFEVTGPAELVDACDELSKRLARATIRPEAGLRPERRAVSTTRARPDRPE